MSSTHSNKSRDTRDELALLYMRMTESADRDLRLAIECTNRGEHLSAGHFAGHAADARNKAVEINRQLRQVERQLIGGE